MGFRREKTYALRWADDTEWAGLEVETRPLPIGAMEQFGALMDLKDQDPEDFSRDDLDAIIGLFRDFGDQALVSWNFEVDEPDPADPAATIVTPVPPTGEGMRKVDLEMGLEIITEWFAAVTGVSDNADGDLGKDSPPGATAPEVSIPMEPLSLDLQSSTTPT